MSQASTYHHIETVNSTLYTLSHQICVILTIVLNKRWCCAVGRASDS